MGTLIFFFSSVTPKLTSLMSPATASFMDATFLGGN